MFSKKRICHVLTVTIKKSENLNYKWLIPPKNCLQTWLYKYNLVNLFLFCETANVHFLPRLIVTLIPESISELSVSQEDRG